MKKIIVILVGFLVLLNSCEKQKSNIDEKKINETLFEELGVDDGKIKKAFFKKDPTGTYGAGVKLTKFLSVDEILNDPNKFENQKMAVKGKIADLCPKEGCWVNLVGDDAMGMQLRVKVPDGEIIFPKSSLGAMATIEGTLKRFEMTEEQGRAFLAKLAFEKGQRFDPLTIQGPQVLWQLNGEGAQLRKVKDM